MEKYTDFDEEQQTQIMSDHNIAYEKRTITPDEQKVLEYLSENKKNYSDIRGFVTVTQDVKLITWNKKHPVDDNMETTVVPAGTTLRICMLSRFNDFGLTDDVDGKDLGYKVRIPIDSVILSDIRKEKEPSSHHILMKAVIDADKTESTEAVDGEKENPA